MARPPVRVSARPVVWLVARSVVWVAALAGLVAGCHRCDRAGARRGSPDTTMDAAEVGGEGAPREGGTLRLMMEAEPPSLNPLVEHDAWTTWLVLGAICEPLVRQDPASGAMSPSLAVAWEAPDERTLRLRLRVGVRWQDGTPFTAADVVATFALLGRPGIAPEVQSDFADVTAVEAPTPHEVVLRLRRAMPLLMQSLAHLAILQAAQVARFAPGELRGQEPSRVPIGTGPFRLAEWRPGERVVLARNPLYWGPRPHLERVECRVVRDREAALELFRRGELDLVWQLSPSQLERVQRGLLRDPALATARVVPWYLPRYAFIAWNLRRPGLGDHRVRQALTLLVDRERYRRVVQRGRARLVTGPYLPGSPSYDPSVPAWPFDPARARALLDEAGIVDHDGDGWREVGGRPFHVTLMMAAGSPTLASLAALMQEDFRRAGVALDAAPTEWAAMLARLRRHDFDGAVLSWVLSPLQDNYALFHSSQAEGGQNYGGFRDAAADHLLETLRATSPGAGRLHLEHALHRLIHDEQPYTFLGVPEIDSLVAARVHGYAPSAAGLGLASLWVE